MSDLKTGGGLEKEAARDDEDIVQLRRKLMACPRSTSRTTRSLGYKFSIAEIVSSAFGSARFSESELRRLREL